ncbi:Suppressor protein stp22 of temperature-sensitive alpha-factor receptor and arginine permease [Savitreella phatthalungensis]
MPPPTEAVLRWLHNILQPEYDAVQRTFDDVVDVLFDLPLRPRTDIYTHEDGRTQLLLMVHGPLPVAGVGSVGVEVWLPQTYPVDGPIVFVGRPPSGCVVRPGNHVGSDRRCYHPVLAYWSGDVRRSTLRGALDALAGVFAKEPPVVRAPVEVEVVRRTREQDSYAHKPPPSLPPRRKIADEVAAMEYALQRQSIAQATGMADEGEDLLGDTPVYTNTRENHPPARPANPVRDTLVDELTHQVQVRAERAHAQFLGQLKELDREREALEEVRDRLSRETATVTRSLETCRAGISILDEKIPAAEKVIEQVDALGQPDVDGLVVPATVVHAQLYNLVAQELALDDTIFVLGKALEQEQIDLDLFLKHIRPLAREQFLKRALIHKISERLGLAL